MTVLYERLGGLPALMYVPETSVWKLRAVLEDDGWKLVLLVDGQVVDYILEEYEDIDNEAGVDWLYVFSMIIRKSANAFEAAGDESYLDLTQVIRQEVDFWIQVSQMQ